MDGRCERHSFEAAEGICQRCGGAYCHECLVYAFGADKPPFCVPCALSASGVRAGGGRAPKASRRERKRRIEEHELLRARRAAERERADSMTLGLDDDDFDALPDARRIEQRQAC